MPATSSPRFAARRFFRFISSMDLAIALLMALALASVIGTVLKQNEPYQNYIVKFGPFWHGVFERMGLYDVYSSPWFLFILAFLIVSTSVCLCRNAPRILAAMRQYQEDMEEWRLISLPNHSRCQTALPPNEAADAVAACFRRLGFRTRSKRQAGKITVAAMKGAGNRLGYLFTHLAVVIICLGGLMDSNAPLKLRHLRGELKAETRSIPISEIPERSKLPVDNPSFRANVLIPEGRAAGAAFVNLKDGYLVQPLPFAIRLKDFRVEHYANGQPKSFESDLVIRAGAETLEHTIAVNHPLRYRDYAIYQASFGDGGSKLRFKLHDLTAPAPRASEQTATVDQTLTLRHGGETRQLELVEFRKHNIFENDDPALRKKFRDYGPSVTFKLRHPDGRAREYLNYMHPVALEGREFLLSGMRSAPGEEFEYLHLPADDDGSPARFLRFLALLNDEQTLRRIYADNQEALVSAKTGDGTPPREALSAVALRLMRLFREGGFPTLQETMAASGPDAATAQTLSNASMKILWFGLQHAFLTLPENQGDASSELSEQALRFLQDSIVALAALPEYGSPYYLQLTDFEHVEATGLQITRSPGVKWVYGGFAMLIPGVFLLLYMPRLRLWAVAKPREGGSELLMAGVRVRHARDFHRYFAQVSDTIKRLLP